MAGRQTATEAQELKRSLEQAFPTRAFRIIDNSTKRTIGRGVAKRNGYTIIEDDGGIMVKVNYTEYLVLEVRKCDCGAEILTAAIGEDGLSECLDCRSKRHGQQNTNSASVREWTARDAWEE